MRPAVVRTAGLIGGPASAGGQPTTVDDPETEFGLPDGGGAVCRLVKVNHRIACGDSKDPPPPAPSQGA